jgi:hypothetical protein
MPTRCCESGLQEADAQSSQSSGRALIEAAPWRQVCPSDVRARPSTLQTSITDRTAPSTRRAPPESLLDVFELAKTHAPLLRTSASPTRVQPCGRI